MQQNSHAEPRRARREGQIPNLPTSDTIHQTVTAPPPVQVAFLRVSASPREPVPAYNRMDTAEIWKSVLVLLLVLEPMGP